MMFIKQLGDRIIKLEYDGPTYNQFIMFRHLSPKINYQEKPQPKKNNNRPTATTNNPPKANDTNGNSESNPATKQIKNLNSFLATKASSPQSNANKITIPQSVIVKHANNSTDSSKIPLIYQKRISAFDDYYQKKPKPQHMKFNKKEASVSGQSYQSEGYVPFKKIASKGGPKSIDQKVDTKSKNLVTITLNHIKNQRGDFKSPNSAKSRQPQSEDNLKRIISFGSKRPAGTRVLSNERSISNKKQIESSKEGRIPVSPRHNPKGNSYNLANIRKNDGTQKHKFSFRNAPKQKSSNNGHAFNKPIHNFKSTPFLNKFPLSSSNEFSSDDIKKQQKPNLQPLLSTLRKEEGKLKGERSKKSYSFNKGQMFMNLKKRQEQHTHLCKQLNTLGIRTQLKLFTQQGQNSIELLLVNKIAQTRNTTIFLVYHKPTHSVYCLKKVNIKELPRHQLVNLINQHKIHQFCRHPHIVRHFVSAFDSQNLYEMMELMQEGTLGNQLKRQILDNMSEQNTLKAKINESITSQISKVNKIKKILYEIIAALKYLHDRGIVHRDIKPDNIFISHNTYKVGDLGSASYNGSQEHVGTLDYAAPQILNLQDYTKSVDIWSLGCIAYELNVGRPPFFHISPDETKRLITEIQYNKSLINDSQLRSLIDHMLVKSSDRWNCEQLLNHIFFTGVKSQIYKL